MVYFSNSKVKTNTEDPLQYIFNENKEKNVNLGYSIVSSLKGDSSAPLVKLVKFETLNDLVYKSNTIGLLAKDINHYHKIK